MMPFYYGLKNNYKYPNKEKYFSKTIDILEKLYLFHNNSLLKLMFILHIPQ